MSLVIAPLCFFRSWLTCTRHKLEVEFGGPHKLAKSARGFGSQVGLRLAGSTASFWGVESNQAHVWLLVVNTDRVAVDYVNVCGVYRTTKR